MLGSSGRIERHNNTSLPIRSPRRAANRENADVLPEEKQTCLLTGVYIDGIHVSW
jgi:hypothetical protein